MAGFYSARWAGGGRQHRPSAIAYEFKAIGDLKHPHEFLTTGLGTQADPNENGMPISWKILKLPEPVHLAVRKPYMPMPEVIEGRILR